MLVEHMAIFSTLSPSRASGPKTLWEEWLALFSGSDVYACLLHQYSDCTVP